MYTVSVNISLFFIGIKQIKGVTWSYSSGKLTTRGPGSTIFGDGPYLGEAHPVNTIILAGVILVGRWAYVPAGDFQLPINK